jgi:hypothetical protein
MKLRHLVQSLADDPLWICNARSNYKRLRCKLPRAFRRLRAATPAPQRRKFGADR